MARLIVVDGPDLGTEFELDRPAEGDTVRLTIGRDPRVALTLADSAVSREHCRIDATPRGFRLVDLESRNRTYLNADPIERSWLTDGDRVVVGDSELLFEDDAPAVDGGVASTIIKELGGATAARISLPSAERRSVDDEDTADDVDLAAAFDSLQRVVRAVGHANGSATVRDLLAGFFSELLVALAADRAAYLVRDKERWVVSAQHDPRETETRQNGGALRASLTVVDRAAQEQKTILSSLGDESNTESAPRSSMAAPVVVNDAVAGVVWVERDATGRPFAARDLELLRAAAEPVGGALERLEEQDRLVAENRNLIRSISETHRIVGESQGIQDVLEFIGRAAPTPMTVLIAGETGTGKELVAAAIHYGSPRRGKPFVALNCAALPENLVESELFGHERGAFTGAVARKKGRFELADTGTVFLDEVAELTLPCQAKLLRLLEERRFERVGGVEAVEVDVRIIAASNRDLLEMVETKEFREDLYYRLSVLNVALPPLRERPDDIILLTGHFLALHATAGGPKKLAKSAEKKLLSYPWPGNVRQLRNVIESAIVLGQGREIRADDLVLPQGRSPGSEAWEPIRLAELERRHVLRMLEHTGGNKKRAAEILGIERCTLYSKLKNYEKRALEEEG